MKKPLKDRVLDLINSHPRTWTARELAQLEMGSYSNARTVLKRLWDAGKIQRIVVSRVTDNGRRDEWAYYRNRTTISEKVAT